MNWEVTFLGLIAAATLVMALIQVGAVIALLRIARQSQETITEVRQQIRPLIAKVSEVVDDASRTASLAAAQAQKVDRLVTDLTIRADETAAIVQRAIVTPAREGLALVAGLKAGLAALRRFQDRPRHGRSADEEDPLFIG